MSGLSHTELERKVKKLVTHGAEPVAQTILHAVGYGPAKLAEGGTLHTTWETSVRTADETLHHQKQATQAEAAARAVANKDLVSFDEMSRTLLAGDEPTLTLLGLTPEQATVKGPDGQPMRTVATRPPVAIADTLRRWFERLDNALGLTGDAAALLAGAGWTVDRLKVVRGRVEAYSQADLDQQTAIRLADEASAQQVQNYEALRHWYTVAAAICRQAIKDADPTDHLQLLDYLDL